VPVNVAFVPVTSTTARQYGAFTVNLRATFVGAVIGVNESPGSASAHVAPSIDHCNRNTTEGFVPVTADTDNTTPTQSGVNVEFTACETV
jgi:hypothetical protein